MKIKSVRWKNFLSAAIPGILLFSLIVAIIAQLYTGTRLSGGGVIRKTSLLGVYHDESCVEPLEYIDWGEVRLNKCYNTTIYVRNEGNIPVNLSMHIENWTPAYASSFLSLTWDQNGAILQPLEVVAANLTLTVGFGMNFTEFTFDIVLTETEAG